MQNNVMSSSSNGEPHLHRDADAQNPLRPRDDGGGGETNRERQEKIRHLQKEAFQLANYYFVFQGIIFTAFYSTQSHVKCQYRWIPFTLSFLAGFINLCSLLGISCTYKTTLDDMDRAATRHRPGNAPPPEDPIAVKCARNWRLFYAGFCMLFVTAFFVITLVGCLTITCGGGGGGDVSHAAAPPSPTAG